MNHEDLLEKILDGVRSEYQSIIDAVNGRDTLISFDELNEKLINKEITLQQQNSLFFCGSYHGQFHYSMPEVGLSWSSSSKASFSTKALHTHFLWLSRWLTCDTPNPGVPLTTRQSAEFLWISGDPIPHCCVPFIRSHIFPKIRQSLIC